MKKFFFFAAAVIGMAASCQKQSNPAPVEDNSPVAVTFGVNAPSIEVTKTKSNGSLDEWGAQDLYIYSFARSTSDFTTEPFIDNVKVSAPAAGLKEDITPKHMVGGVEESFYYKVDNTTFDFYGYYVDDAATAEPVVAADVISVPVTINGAQDIMLAKASQINDVKGTAVDPSRAYSAYSARKGIKPVLKFEHQLARFNFFVVAGSASTTESGNEVSVTSISINETNVEGTLNIVGAKRGLVPAEPAVADDLYLRDEGVETLAPVIPNAYVPERNNPKKVGESIMVIPNETSYSLMYELKQEGVTDPVSPAKPITLNIADFGEQAIADGAFLAGKQYNVTLTVYGLEKVVITAELAEWVDGGDYGYDPDEDWDNEPIVVPGSAYVYDDLSWATLPVSYRSQHPWDDATYATFPWLAVWFEAIAEPTNLATTVSYTNAEGVTSDAPMTGLTNPAPYPGTANPETVLTLNETELGTEIVPGTWTVTVTNADTAETIYTATITVPAE